MSAFDWLLFAVAANSIACVANSLWAATNYRRERASKMAHDTAMRCLKLAIIVKDSSHEDRPFEVCPHCDKIVSRYVTNGDGVITACIACAAESCSQT